MAEYQQAEDVIPFEETTAGLGSLLAWFSTDRPLSRRNQSIELTGAKVWLCEKVILQRGWYWKYERALLSIAPNEKCPCESGKKYKKCCHHEQLSI